MICSLCSAGAALYRVKEELPRNTCLSGTPVRLPDIAQKFGEILHKLCKGCDCQHKSNVVTGIDWSKIKGVSRDEHDEQKAAEEV